MNPESRKSIVKAGALLFLAVIAMQFFGLSWPVDYHPQKLLRPMIALEMPHDVDEFQAVVAAAPGAARHAQYADFGFILAYSIFFFVFGIGIADDRTAVSMWLAMLVTALADIGEDVFILHAIGDTAPSPAALRSILIFGCAKWLGFFTIVLAAAVAMQEGSVASRVAALVLRLAALVGIYAALASFVSAAARPLVTIALTPAVLTFFCIVGWYAVSLARQPAEALAAA